MWLRTAEKDLQPFEPGYLTEGLPRLWYELMEKAALATDPGGRSRNNTHLEKNEKLEGGRYSDMDRINTGEGSIRLCGIA